MSDPTGIDLVYQLILDDVKRPDMKEKIWRRIHRAILTWHRLDNWKRDFNEQIYFFENPITAVPNQPQVVSGANALFMNWAGQVQNTINVQQMDVTELIRFRKIGYLRKFQTVTSYGAAIFDPTNGQQGTVQGGDLLERSPDSMFDGYGFDKTDVFYRSGNQINISSSTPLDRVFVGYFSDPLVNLGASSLDSFERYESWIVDNYPGVIVADVKAKVFNDIGKNEEANGVLKGELPMEVMRLQSNETLVSLR